MPHRPHPLLLTLVALLWVLHAQVTVPAASGRGAVPAGMGQNAAALRADAVQQLPSHTTHGGAADRPAALIPPTAAVPIPATIGSPLPPRGPPGRR